MSKLWAAVLAAVMTIALAAPASAITRGGVPDGDEHPYVGLIITKVEGIPDTVCTGALVAPTVLVTAAHCTAGATSVDVWFETDLLADPDGALFGVPFGGETSVSGQAQLHPEFDPEAFFLYDLSVVELDEPVQLDRYATLPEVGAVDAIPNGRKQGGVTVVGYGLQQVRPEVRWDLTRYRADVMVVDRRGVAGIGRFARTLEGAGSFLVSGDARHGGTCFGDSGAPALLGDTIVGVVSFGLNANCAGPSGVYRLDKAPDLAFIEGFLDADGTRS